MLIIIWQQKVATNLQFIFKKCKYLPTAIKWNAIKQGMPVNTECLGRQPFADLNSLGDY